MKISEVIGDLSRLMKEYGDIEVWAGIGRVLHRPEILIGEDITGDEYVRIK